MSKKFPTAAERYKAEGRVQFSCWLMPATIKAIKTLAFANDTTIPGIIADKFSDVKVEKVKGKVTVTFDKVKERAEV